MAERIEIIPESIKLLKMSDEEYFSPKYKDYISNSKLKLINPDEGGSSELWFEGMKSTYSESFELGSAVHEMLLQPDSFFISDIKKPSGKLGRFADLVFQYMENGVDKTEALKIGSIDADYYSGKMSKKRLDTALESCEPYWEQRLAIKDEIFDKVPIYLSEGMSNKFECCMNGILSNPKFKKTLYPEGFLVDPEYFNEYAYFADAIVYFNNGEEEIAYPIKLKGKFDNFTIDEENSVVTLNDLKTTGKPVAYFMGCNAKLVDEDGNEFRKWIDGSFQKFHYHRQMGMYTFLLQSYITQMYKKTMTFRANMLVVETIPEFKSKIFTVANGHIKKGLDELKRLLILVAKAEWEKQR